MNISDIKIDHSKYKGKDMVHVMFDKQDELRKMYGVKIMDLDVPSDQQEIRAMAYSAIEESAEMLDVLRTSDHREHLLDENADFVSFYLELLIISGLTKDDIKLEKWKANRNLDELPKIFTEFITDLSLSINTLKNRYWRKTNLLTDRNLYYHRLKKTIKRFRELIQATGISFDEMVDAYLRKWTVNEFRIKSKY